MKKTAYSLILMDDVVRKIDDLAHTRGESRSGLINQILAEYVSLRTPQQFIREVFDHIAATAASEEIVPMQPSASILQMRSVLTAHYNPTIKYTVEIALEKGRYICRFKSISRTQSNMLMTRLTMFYEVWTQIEHSTLAGKREGAVRVSISGGKFRREMMIGTGGNISDDAGLLGKAIGDYIRMFDRALKICLTAEHGMDMKAFDQIHKLYEAHLKDAQLIL